MPGPVVKETEQRRAMTTIDRLGGIVERDLSNSEAPVVSINLAETKVTDEDLLFLAALPDLQALYLMETQITNAGLAHLKDLSNLRTLNLGLTRVSGPGLKHLKGLIQLRTLWLADTDVTDAG